LSIARSTEERPAVTLGDGDGINIISLSFVDDFFNQAKFLL